MRILRMMKKKSVVLMFGCALMLATLTTGCGKEKEEPIPVDLSSESRQNGEENRIQSTEEDTTEDLPEGDASAEEDKQTEAKKAAAEENQPPTEDKQTEDSAQASQADQASGTEELECDVKSIGQDSFVAIKCTTYSDGDKGFMVSAPAPGYEEADDLVTVYVNENCTYQYKTVRNGGVNPEDVSSREGSFGDLKDGMLCNVKGSWRDGAFYADSIVMSEFV